MTDINAVSKARLPTKWGLFQMVVYHDQAGKEHVLLHRGDLKGQPLVRIHSECLTGDVFSSKRCDCGPQLDEALLRICKEGAGVLIYLRQEGRGIGLTEKAKAYELQDQGLDTVEANLALGHEVDMRTYEVAVKMLNDLGVTDLRLMTNNPVKVKYLEEHGLKVTTVAIVIEPTDDNREYLRTKAEKLGHNIPF